MNNCPCSREITRQIHKRDEMEAEIRKHVISGGVRIWTETFGVKDTFDEIERIKAIILTEPVQNEEVEDETL